MTSKGLDWLLLEHRTPPSTGHNADSEFGRFLQGRARSPGREHRARGRLAPTGDPHLKTEVEIRFMAQGTDGTLVELEHQHLERYGARPEQMPAIVDSEDGWSDLRASVARLASA